MQTFEKFKELLTIKRYSDNTIKTYMGMLLAFQKYVGYTKPIQELDTATLLQYVTNVIKAKNLSRATQKQLLAVLKLYYKEMFQKEISFYSVYPRDNPKVLPIVLSSQEVKRILESTPNLKHKAMLTLIYALGLRSGELIKLKLSDIHKDRKQIHIKGAKGKKDRVLPIPDSLRNIVNDYFVKYKPHDYLFNGQARATYSAQSLRKVFHASCKRANIKKQVTLHSLRHAYATHLMEKGVSVRVIQELLGHTNIRTTMIYTHVTAPHLEKIPSPLDFL